MTNYILKTNEDVLGALHPILKKDLEELNKLDEVVEEIKNLNNSTLKISPTAYYVVDEYSFLWPTIVSFGSEKVGVSVNIYK